MLKVKGQTYSYGFKMLHWIIALLVIGMLSAGFFLDDLPKAIKPWAIMMHKSIGLTVLVLMITRLLWIIRTGKPRFPGSMAAWEKVLAYGVQYSLYLTLILIPLAGWVMSVAAGKPPVFFGLFTLSLPWIAPSKALGGLMFEIHSTLAWVTIGLLVLHIAGALKHYYWDKDTVLQGMLP